MKTQANAELVGEYWNCKMYFSNISYNCPVLGLYGFNSQKQLQSAIRKKLVTKPPKKG